MSLLSSILDANGGAAVREMARSVGISEADAQGAVQQLLPAIARGIRRNASRGGGLEELIGALKSGGHRRYVDHPEDLAQPDTIVDGNAILGHVLGSKQVSRNVAGRAARETGLDAGVLKQMLPMVAAAAMGCLGKQVSGGGALGALSSGPSRDPGMAGMLESFLDSDRDGAVLDDVLDLARKFL